MTQEHERRWEEAGLTDAATGALHRLLPDGTWAVPDEIELDGARLTWGLEYYHDRKSGPELLRQFTRLENGTPEQILRFASSWGVLLICEHDLPSSHPPTVSTPVLPGTMGCVPPEVKGRDFWYWEPLDAWRRLARRARAILNTVAALRMDIRPSAEDFDALGPDPPDANYDLQRANG